MATEKAFVVIWSLKKKMAPKSVISSRMELIPVWFAGKIRRNLGFSEGRQKESSD